MDSHFAVTLLRLRRLRCKCELGCNDDIDDVSGFGGTSGLVMMLSITPMITTTINENVNSPPGFLASNRHAASLFLETKGLYD